jgi:N6-adenosine-specific RNA methylase IME4
MYDIIYADPPWMEVGGGKIKRGADAHYSLMKTQDIINLQVPSNDNAHLYLWVTNNKLQDGLDVMKAWGFTYKTVITWMKDRFGLGQYFRGITEHCLFGVKGNLPYKIVNGKRQQGVTGFIASRTVHSQKPDDMIAMINKVSYIEGMKRLEIFAREKREGWDSLGYGVGSEDIRKIL